MRILSEESVEKMTDEEKLTCIEVLEDMLIMYKEGLKEVNSIEDKKECKKDIEDAEIEIELLKR